MKFNPLILFVAFLSFHGFAFAQIPVKIDIQSAVKNAQIEIFNRKMSLIDENAYPGIRLSKDTGEGVAWLKGIEFANGVIEFDVRGENLKQHSFVGLAFYGQDNLTYDAIYLRPFQFEADDEVLRKRSIQYISFPANTWRLLRENSPGKYENSIEPSPDPDAWIRMRIVIKDGTISTYINGNEKPCLVVEKLTKAKSGALGFYVADTSGGDFANISIIKTD